MSEYSRKYKCLIFDWDGTLMDSAGLIVRAVCLAAEQVSLPVPDPDNVRHGIGTSFDAQYKRLFGAESMDSYASFKDSFYSMYNQEVPKLYPGVEQLLSDLQDQGYYLAIATSGSRRMLKDMFSEYNVAQYFALTCTADEFNAKPDPEMLRYIMSVLKVDESQTLMIGDSVNDVFAAKNAGVDCLGVTGGVGSGDDLLGAGAFDVVVDIQHILRKI